eukprot:jgi/Mesvir1/16440/Mv18160-RA.1
MAFPQLFYWKSEGKLQPIGPPSAKAFAEAMPQLTAVATGGSPVVASMGQRAFSQAMRAAMRSHFAGHLSERAPAGNLRFFTVCTSSHAFLSLPERVLKAFVPCDGPGSDGSVLLASFEDPSKLSSVLGNNWWEMTYKRTSKMEVHGPIEFIHAPATGITTFRSAHVRSISEGGRVQWDTEDTSTFRR